MKKIPFAILPLIFALALSTLACAMSLGGPTYPDTPTPASATEDPAAIEKNFQAAATAAASNGELTLKVTESQLTYIVAKKINEDPDPVLTQPQVYLRDGQIQIYGKIVRNNIEANVRIVITATVNDTGRPTITVVSTDFGPFPAPPNMNEAISQMVEEAFTGSFGPAATGFRLKTISIADGVMTISGRIK